MSVMYEKKDMIAYLTINRPEHRNALDPQTITELYESWVDFSKDDNLRVAIITGAGGESFCAGADLGKLIPLLTGKRKPETEVDHKIAKDPMMIMKALLRGYDVFKPVIAAVNGYCIAGGMEMLQAVDIRVNTSAHLLASSVTPSVPENRVETNPIFMEILQ